MKRFSEISLKNKIFFSILAVILIISTAIAFLARWILISSLLSELELRGSAIARTIAEHGSGYVLDKNYPQLLSLIFDGAQVKERKHLIDYIFIVDQENSVLSHTFTHRFPEELRLANQIPANDNKSVQLLAVDKQAAYDIALPINEGLYRIGTVHVGLNKGHIDNLVSKLRFTFLGFISLVIVIVFIVSHRIAKYITRPISKLTEMSDELSHGNLDIKLDRGSHRIARLMSIRTSDARTLMVLSVQARVCKVRRTISGRAGSASFIENVGAMRLPNSPILSTTWSGALSSTAGGCTNPKKNTARCSTAVQTPFLW